MKKMKYGRRHKAEVLYSGTYKEHEFGIVSFGTHPCAYVENKIDDLGDYGDKRLWGVDVHGYFTFLGERNFIKEGIQFLGWGYHHWDDYDGDYRDDVFWENGRMWDTEEIFEEVQSVIDQLIKVEAGDIE